MMASAPTEEELSLYPRLNPQNFRFGEIANIKQYIEKDLDKNLFLYKKYKKLSAIVSCFRYIFLFSSILLNAIGIATLTKIFKYDLTIYFETTTLIIDVVVMFLLYIETKIIKKIEKHDEAHTLAASFLSALMNHFSKALEDANISQQELTLVLDQQAKYLQLRKEIRTKDFHQSDSQDIVKQFRKKVST